VNIEYSARAGNSYSFLDFTLDLSSERLVRGTTEIKLRPKSFQVMRCLVEGRGRLVTREELMQAVWGDVAVTDESITKCIADIRKALGDDSQEIIRTVTRRGFLFQPEIRRIQPTQAQNEQHSAIRAAPQPSSLYSRRLLPGMRVALKAGLAALVLVASLIGLQWRWDLFNRRPAYRAIAVLPFESLSTGADQQYLADGMTEALITNLGRASPLRVIARTSVNQYEGTKKPIRVIARELNVDVVVEGTITQSGDRLRVTANLIQVSPEKHIWANSYERNFRDALELQNELSDAIAGEIQGKLTPRQQPRSRSNRPVNPEAQLAYWKARYLLKARKDSEATAKSIEYAEQAVRIDPSYAPAHAMLAMSYAMLSDGETIPRDAVSRAKTAAHRAIALDEELADAHVALGVILIVYDWDWAGAERELSRALSLNPSDADGRQWLANYLAAFGRVEEAVVEMKRARELDPFSFRTNWNVGRILCLARKYDEALAELRQAGDMQRNASAVDIWIFKSLFKKGLSDDAAAVDLRIRDYRDGLNAESLDALRAGYSKNGLQGYWTKLRELLLPRFRSTANGVYRLAEINAYLGDKDEAFRWLEKAYESRTSWMPWIRVDPSMDPLRSDPRFNDLLQRMGLTP